MGYPLEAETAAGREFVALCEAHAGDFEARAEGHDRDGTFPFENFDDLKRSGAIRATVPTEFGGLGVTSVRDMAKIDLTVCRALVDRVGRLLDGALVDRPVADDDPAELKRLFTEFQATKFVVNRKAIEIVDRALTLSGGAGFLSASPLARLYRDVRAGPFMQPLSPNEAPGYIGRAALGVDTGGYD